jgi:aspartyl-tRNA(Asn)/glutamyl-tRNA(Gln) amidotransferase subunit A
MIDLAGMTISGIRERIAGGHVSAREIAEAYLAAIASRNPSLNAYLEVFDDVLESAAAVDRLIAAGHGGALAGVPIALKDNILVNGKRASAGSKIIETYRATYDSTVAVKLKAAGAVFLGRTNMDEFAMGSSTENSAYGVVRNPVDESRVPGGSSGGSAAAVAAGLAPAALGSDTGGSIRQPASFCGLVGLKPTYGAVSRHGLIALGSSLDQIGPFTHTVADAELLFRTLQGADSMDSATLSYVPAPTDTSSRERIGVPRTLIEREGIDPDVLKNFNDTVERLRGDGFDIQDIELPNVPYSLAVYYIIMPAEASSNLARFDGMRFGTRKEGATLLEDYTRTRGQGFGRETRRRIILGTYVLSSGYYDAFYGKATAVRAMIRGDFAKAFSKVGAILTPTAPTPAFKAGEKANDPLSMYLSDIFTVPANVAGVPAISVPSGTVSRDSVDLPVGVQVIAPHMREDTLFSIGRHLMGEL